MPYEIVYERKVVRENIPEIPAANKAQIIRAINERLTVDPIGLGKPLVGEYKGLRRLRVGDWRIIYEVSGGKVFIYSIKLRRDSYKGL